MSEIEVEQPQIPADKDFFTAVNQEWLDNTEFLPDYPSVSNFIQLHEKSQADQLLLLENIVEQFKQDPESLNQDQKNIAVAFTTRINTLEAMDQDKTDFSSIQYGFEFLQKHLADESDWAKSLNSFAKEAPKQGFFFPLSFDKGLDLQDSDNVKADLAVHGFCLPGREYYLEDSFESQREAFKAHLETVAELITAAGLSLENNWVEKVISVDRFLALISLRKEDSRHYPKYYNMSSISKLAADIWGDAVTHPDKWTKDEDILLKNALDIPMETNKEEIVAFTESFFENYPDQSVLDAMTGNFEANFKDEFDPMSIVVFDGDMLRRFFAFLATTSPSAIRAFLQYKQIKKCNSYCSKALDESFFEFYTKLLSGQEEQKSHIKRAINFVNQDLKFLLGKVYIDSYDFETTKKDMKTLVDKLIVIMESSLVNNEWLGAETREEAVKKIQKFKAKICFPDQWEDFSKLDLSDCSGDMGAIARKIAEFKYDIKLLAKLNTPDDPYEWLMSPQTVNAYFHPLKNEIVFPASILQPPFFYKIPQDADAVTKQRTIARNYGAIGVVIAHEITHGYDDSGRQYDSNANARDWWTEEDAASFNTFTDAMTKQVEKYEFVAEPEEEGGEAVTYKMNAQLTMGENLADLGGLTVSMKAFKDAMETDELFADCDKQLLYREFCISYAKVWRGKFKQAGKINRLKTDPHAPAEFRGCLCANIPEFYEGFGFDESHPNYIAPEDRIAMW